MDEVTIATFGYRDEAEISLAHLGALGIVGRVVADDEGGLNPGFFADYAVRLVVMPDHEEAARRALEDFSVMIRLPTQIHDAIVAHAIFCAPHEACGLIAVDATGELRMAYCLTNVDGSPRRFTVSPQEHFMAIQHAERNGWSIGGVFHSHPAAAPRPSRRDIEASLDDQLVQLIVGPLTAPEVRAYRIQAATSRELVVALV